MIDVLSRSSSPTRKRKERRLVISSLRFLSIFDSNGQHRRNVPVPTVSSRHPFSLRSTVVRRLLALSDELRTRNDADATTRLQSDVLRRRDAFADLSESESDVRRISQRAGRGRRSAIGASVCHPGRKHSSEPTALRSSVKEKKDFLFDKLQQKNHRRAKSSLSCLSFEANVSYCRSRALVYRPRNLNANQFHLSPPSNGRSSFLPCGGYAGAPPIG